MLAQQCSGSLPRFLALLLFVVLQQANDTLSASSSPEGQNTAQVASGAEFVAALADQAVTDIVLTTDVSLSSSDFVGYPIPLPLLRNITVGGVEGRVATLDMGWLKNKVRSANGTAVTVQYAVLAQFNEATAQAPGVDLFAPLPPGQLAGLVMRHGAMVTPYCFPESLASAVSSAYERPPFLPGVNSFLATSPPPVQPCVNDAAAPPLQRCWAHVGRHLDFSGAVSYVDAVGKSVPNGYYSHLVDVYVLCEHQLTEQCVQDYGPLGCMLRATAGAMQLLPPPPPADGGNDAAAAAQPPAAAPTASGGVVASAAGDAGGTPVAAVGAGVGIGVGLLLTAVAAAALVVRRRAAAAARAAADLAAPPGADPEKAVPPAPLMAAGGKRGGPGGGKGGKDMGRGAAFPDSGRSTATTLCERCGCYSLSSMGLPPAGGCGAKAGFSCGCAASSASASASGSGCGLGGAGSSGLGGDSCSTAITSAGASSDASLATRPPRPPIPSPFASSTATAALQQQLQLAPPPPPPPYGAGAGPGSDVAAAEGAAEADPGFVVVTHRTPRRPDVQLGPSAAAEVQLLPVIRGRGSFGRVYEGLYGGQRVAVKVLAEAAVAEAEPPDGGGGAGGGGAAARQVLALAQEVEVLGRCCHPHVVRLHAACLTPPRFCLVMELCETNLERLMDGAPGRLLPMHTVLGIAMDVARALEYLHPTIVHRDLKPANVLINGAASPRPVAKLSDFGLSRLRHTVRSTAHPCAGTPAYIAPECYDISTRVVLHHADMYSFGTLLWTLLSGREPWQELSVMAIAYKVAGLGERPPLGRLAPGRCPPRLRALMAACWEADPRRRPAAAEVAKELLAAERELLSPGCDAPHPATATYLSGSPPAAAAAGRPNAGGSPGLSLAAVAAALAAASGAPPPAPAHLHAGGGAAAADPALYEHFLGGAGDGAGVSLPAGDYSLAMMSGIDLSGVTGLGGGGGGEGGNGVRRNSTLCLEDMPFVRLAEPMRQSPVAELPVLQLDGPPPPPPPAPGQAPGQGQGRRDTTGRDAAAPPMAQCSGGAVAGVDEYEVDGGGDGGAGGSAADAAGGSGGSGGSGLLQSAILRELGVVVLTGLPGASPPAGGGGGGGSSGAAPPSALRSRAPPGRRSGSAGLWLRRAAAAGAAGFNCSWKGSGSGGGGWGAGGEAASGGGQGGVGGGVGFLWPEAVSAAAAAGRHGGANGSASMPAMGSPRLALMARAGTGPGGAAAPGVVAVSLEAPGGREVGVRRGLVRGGSRREGRLAAPPALEPVPEAAGWA